MSQQMNRNLIFITGRVKKFTLEQAHEGPERV